MGVVTDGVVGLDDVGLLGDVGVVFVVAVVEVLVFGLVARQRGWS